MILVQVMPIVSEDDIWLEGHADLSKILFDALTNVGKTSIFEILDHHSLRSRILQQEFRAPDRLVSSLFFVGAENNPVDFDVSVLLAQLDNRASTANFDIITMRPKT
jgi:hypothetical protein